MMLKHFFWRVFPSWYTESTLSQIQEHTLLLYELGDAFEQEGRNLPPFILVRLRCEGRDGLGDLPHQVDDHAVYAHQVLHVHHLRHVAARTKTARTGSASSSSLIISC
jgi:hypothetical protein